MGTSAGTEDFFKN